MKMRTRDWLLAALALAATGCPNTSVSSTFDDGSDGWEIVSGGNGTVGWSASGGNSGGFLLYENTSSLQIPWGAPPYPCPEEPRTVEFAGRVGGTGQFSFQPLNLLPCEVVSIRWSTTTDDVVPRLAMLSHTEGVYNFNPFWGPGEWTISAVGTAWPSTTPAVLRFGSSYNSYDYAGIATITPRPGFNNAGYNLGSAPLVAQPASVRGNIQNIDPSWNHYYRIKLAGGETLRVDGIFNTQNNCIVDIDILNEAGSKIADLIYSYFNTQSNASGTYRNSSSEPVELYLRVNAPAFNSNTSSLTYDLCIGGVGCSDSIFGVGVAAPERGFVAAPEKFLGDWGALDGVGMLSFDHRIKEVGGCPDRWPLEVRIKGPSGEAKYVSTSELATENSWKTFKAPIDRSRWALVSGDWTKLIRNVTALEIAIEGVGNYCTPFDKDGLDNVTLTPAPAPSAPPPPPEPTYRAANSSVYPEDFSHTYYIPRFTTREMSDYGEATSNNALKKWFCDHYAETSDATPSIEEFACADPATLPLCLFISACRLPQNGNCSFTSWHCQNIMLSPLFGEDDILGASRDAADSEDCLTLKVDRAQTWWWDHSNDGDFCEDE